MFFQLITNQPFSNWREVFGNTTINSAIIDILLHYSVIVSINDKSYRIKDLVQEDLKNQKNS